MGVNKVYLLSWVICNFVALYHCYEYNDENENANSTVNNLRDGYHHPPYEPTSRPGPPTYRPSSSTYPPRPSPTTRRPSPIPPTRPKSSPPTRPKPSPPTGPRPSPPTRLKPSPPTSPKPSSPTRPKPSPSTRTTTPSLTTRLTTSTPRPMTSTTTPKPSPKRLITGFKDLPPLHVRDAFKVQGLPVSRSAVENIQRKYISYPGQYGLPVRSPHVGYYYAPRYPYSIHDTGSTALGYYLAYTLRHISTPTYSHYSFYDGYPPRYDHYTIHHYYHNRDSVAPTKVILSEDVIACVGDSANMCPGNTTSLCTSNGVLMCVVSVRSTTPCELKNQIHCFNSAITCHKINKAAECQNVNTTRISIPCISTAKIYGGIKLINSTTVHVNYTVSTNGKTNRTKAARISSTTIITNTADNTGNVTMAKNYTFITYGTNITATTITSEYSTKYPITTTPAPVLQKAPINITALKKPQIPQNYCVLVVAVPAEKPTTDGEKV